MGSCVAKNENSGNQSGRQSSTRTEVNNSLGQPRKSQEPYNSLEEVEAGLKKVGLESSNLILAVDFTKSNKWTGSKSFGGLCLHDTSQPGIENPYQKVMRIIAKTLGSCDEDSIIPAFGFGDIHTKGESTFPFFPDRPCHGLEEVLTRYNEIVRGIDFSGPTNFAPAIYKAIELVKHTQSYHILVIIADGQVDKKDETIKAIVDASHHPLSIVCIGVGDGPWETMVDFDDEIPQRKFDNFQFVNMNEIEAKHGSVGAARVEAEFDCAALMELPQQVSDIRRLRLL